MARRTRAVSRRHAHTAADGRHGHEQRRDPGERDGIVCRRRDTIHRPLVSRLHGTADDTTAPGRGRDRDNDQQTPVTVRSVVLDAVRVGLVRRLRHRHQY